MSFAIRPQRLPHISPRPRDLRGREIGGPAGGVSPLVPVLLLLLLTLEEGPPILFAKVSECRLASCLA